MNPDYVLSDKIIRKLNKFINYLNSFVKVCGDANELIMYQHHAALISNKELFTWEFKDNTVYIIFKMMDSNLKNPEILIPLFSKDTELSFSEKKVFFNFKKFVLDNFYIVKTYNRWNEYYDIISARTHSVKPVNITK